MNMWTMQYSKWSITVIITLVLVIITTFASRTHSSGCSSSSSENLTEKFIEKIASEAEKLSLSDFEHDVILTLKVDRANSVSSYHKQALSSQKKGSPSSPSQSTKPVYSHEGIDTEKLIVVLHAGNNKSKGKYEKRRFVLLRQTPTNNKEYFASFAYVRNAERTDKSKFSVDGGGKEEFSIEFAPWDSRDDENDEKKGLISTLGWTECRETIFVPCSSNETLALQLMYSSEKMADTLIPTTTIEPTSMSIIISDGQEVEISTMSPTPTRSPNKNSSSSILKIVSADPGWGERDCTYEFYGDLDIDTQFAMGAARGYAGDVVRYVIKGKIVETTLTGKVESEVVKHIKNGDMSLTDLNPDLLKAIMAKYGKEKVKGGKTTFNDMYNKLNFTRLTVGNESFLSEDFKFEVTEIDDGSNDTSTLHEEEIVTGPPVKPTARPGETTPKPATPGSPAQIVININNVTIINNSNVNSSGSTINNGKGNKTSSGKPWWSASKKPGGSAPTPAPSNNGQISEEDRKKFYEEFRKKLIDEASKHCPVGKKCRIKPAPPEKKGVGGGGGGGSGLTPFTGGSYGAVGGVGAGSGMWYKPPTYPGLYPPYLLPLKQQQTIVVVGGSGACVSSPFYGCVDGSKGKWAGRSAVGLEDIFTNVDPLTTREDDLGDTPSSVPLSDVSSYLSHPGWKPLSTDKTTNISLDYEQVPFIGFGYCPPRIVTHDDLTQIVSNDDATSFYMDIVRIRCIHTERKYFEALFDRKCLNLNADKSLKVPESCPYLKRKKLTLREFEELSRAFELSVFSEQFVSQLKRPDKLTLSPDERPISRFVFTLGKMVISALTLYPAKVPNHLVKLTRNLVLTLKTAFIKAFEDRNEINERCHGQDGCSVDKAVNENDRIYLLSLAEFIIRGVGPKTQTMSQVKKTFYKFYKSNRQAIEKRVADYNT